MKASDLSKAVWASAYAVSLAILPIALSACNQTGTNDGGGTGSDTMTTPGGTTGGAGTTGGTTGGTTATPGGTAGGAGTTGGTTGGTTATPGGTATP